MPKKTAVGTTERRVTAIPKLPPKSPEQVDRDVKYIAEIDQNLKSDDSVVRNYEAFEVWLGYPLLKEWMVDDSPLPAVRGLLDNAHEAATTILVKLAIESSLESQAIFQSSYYCRDLLFLSPRHSYNEDRRTFTWPDTLGERLYQLPADVRQTILNAHYAVAMLFEHHFGDEKSLESTAVKIVNRLSTDIFNSNEVAAMVHLSRKSLGPYEKSWPKFLTGSGNRPHQYRYAELAPHLRTQFSELVIPDDPPNRPIIGFRERK